MDVSALTKEEAENLLRQTHARLDQIQADARSEQADRTGRIEESIASLNTLLGPVGAPPGIDSIRAVRQYDGQTMADNAAVALPLAFEGLEILAAVVRDIAISVAGKPS